MRNIIISSHGARIGEHSFGLQANWRLAFYCKSGELLTHEAAYYYLERLRQGSTSEYKEWLCDMWVNDYLIWPDRTGEFTAEIIVLEEGKIHNITDKMRLSEIMDKYNVEGEECTFHCLFCRESAEKYCLNPFIGS